MVQAIRMTCAGCALCFAIGIARAAPPPPTLTANELRMELQLAQARIRSIHVITRGNGKMFDTSRPPGLHTRREIAVKAPSSLFHHGAHGHDQMDWHDDQLQQRAYVTANHTHNEWPRKRIYASFAYPADDVLPGSLQGEMYFTLTGLWPLDSRPTPKLEGRPYMLRDVAASEDYSTVRPHLEKVDGHWCHVLEAKGLDTLWLDTARSVCLMARETFDGDTHRQRNRIELGGYQEVAQDVWLPSWIHNVQYDYTAQTDEQSKRRIVDSRITITEASANDVEDDVFQFHPRPGSLSYDPNDPKSQLKQTETGGLDYLDEMVAWIERHHYPDGQPRSESWLGHLAGTLALLVILSLEIRQRLRKEIGTGNGAIRSNSSARC